MPAIDRGLDRLSFLPEALREALRRRLRELGGLALILVATLLALAGLKRLGLADHATAVLDVEEFLPAVGQGAIGIETRAQLDMLREIGCDLGQGYYFAAPMDADADWLAPTGAAVS